MSPERRVLREDRPRRWRLFAVVLVLLLAANGLGREWVKAERSAAGLVPVTAEQAEDPAEFAGSVALGPLRAFVNLYLWSRAVALERAGEYAPLVDLYRQITTLQPQNPRVWSFVAEQMIYTLSSTAGQTRLAWAWVVRGLESLDRGIASNPFSARLRADRALFFWFKAGRFLLRVLRRELTGSLLAREPAWQAQARADLAAFDALPPRAREAITRAFAAIDTDLAATPLAEFDAFVRLPRAEQVVMLRLARYPPRLGLLAYAQGMEARGISPQALIYAQNRALDLLETEALPPTEASVEASRVLEHVARCWRAPLIESRFELGTWRHLALAARAYLKLEARVRALGGTPVARPPAVAAALARDSS